MTNFKRFKEIKIFKSKKFNDSRGFFEVDVNLLEIKKKFKIKEKFIQVNKVYSKKNVIRGIHYQVSPYRQSKIVYVLEGKILDVAVDLRKSSKYYGKYFSVMLSDKNLKKIYIPKGFGHGYLCKSKYCKVIYLTSGKYSPKHQRFLCWNDNKISIDWKIKKQPILSKKDKLSKSFK